MTWCRKYWCVLVVTWNLPFFQVDVSADIAYVMAPKEEPELLIMKKACFVSVDVFNKYLKDQIMEIIDSDKVSRLSLLFLHHISRFST